MSILTKLKHRFLNWVIKKIPSCEVMTERISLAQDGKLSLWGRLMFRIHLDLCHWCTAYNTQMTFITEATRARAKDDASVKASRNELSSDARRRIMQTLRDADSQ
ncbi:MAG: zf-HC2 domain-containing protein [candidate division Zixibacteria bacterium]|nr:zf-HC2 domain-containing protein [candidate division Zixibacteria bacterium]MDH3937214.1 zf-HC2 domain-containing protein [candidate division Zixibacteria bacterium]MDH4032671.1 zf-HC2 domain-containing protein [candidate division Zixibacteria bacterium]